MMVERWGWSHGRSLDAMPDPAIDAALGRATAGLPQHEDRPAQAAMADAVARAICDQRHLIVQAGTGTGKSLAYLVPTLALGARAVVSTATKALQDQLANRDLPHLANTLEVPFKFAVLKGRSNYICRQRVAEVAGGDQQLVLDAEAGASDPPSDLGPLGREIRRLVEWSASAGTGDRAELAWEPSPVAWAQVSVGARDCPGAGRCPSGSVCFAEAARDRAAEADVVVVNTHLYVTALAIGGDLLPPHDLVVFDEAHELEDIASAAFGFEIGAGRFQALARTTRPLLDDQSAAAAVEEAGLLLGDALHPHRGALLTRPLDEATQERLTMARQRVQQLQADVRRALRAGVEHADTPLVGGEPAGGDLGIRARHLRVQQGAGHLLRDLDEVLELSESQVAWVEGPDHAPVLRVAPLDVGARCRSRVPCPALGRRGLPYGRADECHHSRPHR
jgi:ATP-dependent DNA helicase DinG